MGERTDDVGPFAEDANTPFERSQEIAGHNAERMRERLAAADYTPGDEPGVVNAPRSDSGDSGGYSDALVEDSGIPARDTRVSDGEHVASDRGSDQSPEQIRDHIEDTRARMGTTIDAIQEKLSPENLMRQAKETARDATIGRAREMASNVADTARETRSTLMDTIRSNPMPVALTAIGLGWLFVSARREASDQREREYWYRGNGWGYDRPRGGYSANQQPPQQPPRQQGSGSRMGQMTDRIQDAAGKVSDQAQDVASSVADKASDKASDAADFAQGQAQRARGWFEQTWDDNPLLLAGAALAVGTIVGLSIPETEMENRLMGETRDDIVQKAQGVAQDTVQRAQQAATAATNQESNQQQQRARTGQNH